LKFITGLSAVGNPQLAVVLPAAYYELNSARASAHLYEKGPMTKRVLVLSAHVGMGHVVAARALERELRARTGVEVASHDALDLTNEIYRKLSNDLYLLLVRRAPHLVGWEYDLTDVPFASESLLPKLWHMANAQPLVRFLKEYDPDITVCTHYMPAQIVAQLMAEGTLHTTLSIVMTDYDFQGLWLPRMFTRFFVALEESRVRMLALGFEERRVTVSGIPIDSAYAEPADRAAVLARYELAADRPVLLISAGAAGGGPARQLVAQAMSLPPEAQAIVVCGTNAQLRRDIEVLTLPQSNRFRVLGFTDDMLDLVRAATLFVGKPGGLTAAECMAAGTPMVVNTPTPGQEERNSDHLLENGAAIRVNDVETFTYKVGLLLADTARLARMREHARRLGQPAAARIVADTLLADQLEPVRFSAAELAQIAMADRDLPAAAGYGQAVALYDDVSGIFLGTLPEGEFHLLRRGVRAPTTHRPRAYVLTLDERQLDRFRRMGGSPELCARLGQRVAHAGPLTLRWTRV
jgi:processive 1,2-diacylglycerol beta-glucosyltransferase